MIRNLLCLGSLVMVLSSCDSTVEKSTPVNPPQEIAFKMPTADEVIERLKQGNERFVHQVPRHSDQGGKRIHEVAEGQHPVAAIISCSDSRVPPEIILDEGLGDLFVIREAGHVADDATLGSIEYAVEHLKTPLIVVLGHENCGAVTATLDAVDKHQSAGGHIERLVADIRPAVETAGLDGSRDSRIARAVAANVKLVMTQISADLKNENVKVIGAIYNLHTGRILWL